MALAEAASEALGHANPDVLLLLAGAQAEAGNLDDAVATGRRAVRLAAASRQPGQAARARAGLNGLLERRQPVFVAGSGSTVVRKANFGLISPLLRSGTMSAKKK